MQYNIFEHLSNANFSFSIVPTPSVTIRHDRVGEVFHQGEQLTLTCVIRLNATDALSNVMVTTKWTNTTMPGNPINIDTNSSTTEDIDGMYRSIHILNPLQLSDSGNYTCTAITSHTSSFVEGSDGVSQPVNITLGKILV